MRLPPQIRWLTCLTAILLVTGCGKKEETAGAPGQTASARNSVVAAAEILPNSAEPSVRASRQGRKLAILPESRTAHDSLLAVFQGSSGQVKYFWEKNGQPLAGEERDRLAAKHLKKGDIITVIVDNDGARHSASITIGNIPPTVRKVAFTNPAIHRGVDIELDVTGDDADDDHVSFTFHWYINDSHVDFVDGPILPGDRFNRGDRVHFLVTPFDGDDAGVPYEGSAIVIPNAPPAFVSSPPLQFSGNTYSYQAQAEDPDGDRITYSLETPPPGMTIESTSGQISWELSDIPDGDYHITIIAEDSEGQKGYQEYTFIMARE